MSSVQTVGPLKALYTFTPLADMLIPTPTQLLREAFKPCTNYVRAKTKSLTFPPLSIARYSFKQLSELGCTERTKMPKLRNGSKGVRVQCILRN